MKITGITLPYRNYNEDAIVIKDDLFVVFDGATGLREKTTDKSQASEMVLVMKKALETSKIDDFEAFLYQLAIDLQVTYNYTGDKSMRPSASLAALHIKDNMAYLYQLGDCAISYETNQLHRFSDQRLVKLDHIGKKLLVHYMKETDFNHAITLVKPTLIKHRNLLNEPNGYMAFQPNLVPEFIVKKQIIRLKHLTSFLIYSDGYYSARDTFNLFNNHQTFFCSNIEQTISNIKLRAYEDNQLISYPRFKIIDDISVIKVVL